MIIAHLASANALQLSGFDALPYGVRPVIHVNKKPPEFLFGFRAAARALGDKTVRIRRDLRFDPATCFLLLHFPDSLKPVPCHLFPIRPAVKLLTPIEGRA